MVIPINSYQFGVEIEITGITRYKAFRIVCSELDLQSTSAHKSDMGYEVRDNDNRLWKVVCDNSIRTERKKDICIVSAPMEYAVEVVTPVLTYYADIDKLTRIAAALKKAGALVNGTTGIHVHVGAKRFNSRTLINILNLFAGKQELLYAALVVFPKRMRYCRKIDNDLISRLNKAQPRTMEQFSEEYYKGFGGKTINQYNRYSRSRYYGLNCHSLCTTKTLEFRLYNSALHSDVIRTYILLSIAMVNYALNQNEIAPCSECEVSQKALEDWLQEIGFIGPEYTTPIKLLKSSIIQDEKIRFVSERGFADFSTFDNDNHTVYIPSSILCDAFEEEIY